MKKKKLNLNKLKVESFITDLKKENVDTVKAGRAAIQDSLNCSEFACPTTFDRESICGSGPVPTNNNESICVCN